MLSIRFRCLMCRRFAAQNIQPLMTPLPVCWFPDALKQFPFVNTGIDFFLHFYIEDTKYKLTKYYGLILTCMVTRATRLESIPELNTNFFLNALRRFASRRCQPKLFLRHNNSKTFVRANEELKRCVRSLDNQRVASELLIKTIVWKFNPPYGPHFGGAWKRLIQNAKRIILIILESKRLTDVFHAIMVDTESMLNS